MKYRAPFTMTQLANVLVAIVLIVVPFHAFLTVWGSTLVGHFTALRLWDELLLGILVIIAGWWLLCDAKLRARFWQHTLMRLIVLYAVFTLLLGATAYIRHTVSLTALGYGLVVDLRFLAWFVCVWLAVQRSAWLREHWPKLVYIPLASVAIFGLLQFFVLPYEFLMRFGYGARTYAPLTTINQDTYIIRVQSFLRGPNPLGAYLVAVIGVLAACLTARKKDWRLWLLLAVSLVTLGVSFSRSAWIGAVVAVLVVVGARLRVQQRKIALVLAAGVVLVIASALFGLRGSRPVQDALLHVDDSSTAVQTSNEQHAYTFHDGMVAVLREPFGEGPGTAGQASWYNNGHPIRNTESYLLQIGEELGWLGLGLFLAIVVMVGYELWRRRSDALALGLLAGLAGLLVVSLLSYTWADDTLAFVWWGLAGVACTLPRSR